jgi:hypothetical protein
VHQAEPDLRKRSAAIRRKNLGQSDLLTLPGEFPFEPHDNLRLFSLERSDCVIFAEHTDAMALSRSWEKFFWMLQRIRYRDGAIGVSTRNHYTEMDWYVATAGSSPTSAPRSPMPALPATTCRSTACVFSRPVTTPNAISRSKPASRPSCQGAGRTSAPVPGPTHSWSA